MSAIRSFGVRLFALTFLFSVCAPFPASFAAESASTKTEVQKTLSVVGQARIEIPKKNNNQFTFTLNVQVFNAPTVKSGITKDKEMITEVKNRLGKNIISLDTSWYDISKNQTSEGVAPFSDGVAIEESHGSQQTFTISHNMVGSIRAENSEEAAQLTSDLMDIGDENSIITVNNISPYYSDTSMMTADETTQNKALEVAFQNAQAKGEKIAKIVKMRLGNVISLSENGYITSTYSVNPNENTLYYALDLSVTFEFLK
ncbi:SIMPL domain-containing protein [Candidatus Peregrinibacteria bacterium]|nr:MAG: SIMPL domain-containing protein [Candidatus Peregrinibacteria bacterium]